VRHLSCLPSLSLFQRLTSPSGAHACSPSSTSVRDGVKLAASINNEPTHSSQSSGLDAWVGEYCTSTSYPVHKMSFSIGFAQGSTGAFSV
jgi:hypothetical protein